MNDQHSSLTKRLVGSDSIIYGPVSSWRLGRSLGIDLLSTRGKTCSFDCTYCQLGRTVHPEVERREFISLERLTRELETVRGLAAHYVTFSGVGEPSLASNLGDAIKIVKETLKLPVAVLTNSSLMSREDVRRELALADIVVAKVDAPNNDIFQSINRPVMSQTLHQISKALQLFREEYSGKLAIQMMFVDANKDFAADMAEIAKRLSPDEVQINTPLRRCAVSPLETKDVSTIRQAFVGIRNVRTVYEASRPECAPLNRKETSRRRPEEEG